MPAIPEDDPSRPLSLLSPRRLTTSISTLIRRQQQGGTIVAIPSVYKDIDTGPDAGTVVGIVLGAVAGFLLLVWLIYSLAGSGGNEIAGEEEVVVRRPRSRRSRRSEVREVSRSPRPARIIVEERRASVPPPPPPQQQQNIRSVSVERRVDGDDIVEVIEDHDPAPRRKRSARNSGYRSVDPDVYAGGNYPQHPVRGNRY